jgi:hypothetical protein
MISRLGYQDVRGRRLVLLAICEEIGHELAIGSPCVVVADGGPEELDEAFRCLVSGVGDYGW